MGNYSGTEQTGKLQWGRANRKTIVGQSKQENYIRAEQTGKLQWGRANRKITVGQSKQENDFQNAKQENRNKSNFVSIL